LRSLKWAHHPLLILLNMQTDMTNWSWSMRLLSLQFDKDLWTLWWDKSRSILLAIFCTMRLIFYNDLIWYITISKYDTFLIWNCSNCNHSQTRSESCNATYCVSLDCILRSVTEIVCKWTNIIIIECRVFYAYATLMFVQGLNDHSFIMVEPRFCSV